MHAAIGKINWVYFREGIDDFEQAFAGLLEILARHKDYVQQHTILLSKALEWTRNQERSRYLLIGEERQAAQEWLSVRFKGEQPPCLPTDLHCRFICDNQKSVASGDAVQHERQRGIKRCNNVLMLIAPASVMDARCSVVIHYAVNFNKRIVPAIDHAAEATKLHPELTGLQAIASSKPRICLPSAKPQQRSNHSGAGCQAAARTEDGAHRVCQSLRRGSKFLCRHLLMQAPDETHCNTLVV